MTKGTTKQNDQQEIVTLGDKEFQDGMRQMELKCFIEVFGEEEGRRLFAESTQDIAENGATFTPMSDEEVDKLIDEDADDELKAFLDEEPLTDEEAQNLADSVE